MNVSVAEQTDSTQASDSGAVGPAGITVSQSRLVPRVPVYYDRRFVVTFTNASSFSLPPPTSPTLGLPNAFSVPQCSHITWKNTCVPGEELPTRYLSSFRCAEGAHWDADLPVGQRVLFGFIDAHGHYGGLTENPYVITGPTSVLTNPDEGFHLPANASGLSTPTSRCKLATELLTSIELVLNPPTNPCNYVMLQIKGGHGPYTLTILNPDKATWADISVDTTSTVLLSNISDPGSTIIMFVVDKDLVRSQVTGEYKLGYPGACNRTMDTLLTTSLDEIATRRNLHLVLIIPTAFIGFICLFAFLVALWRWKTLAQRAARWKCVAVRSSRMLDERATGSVTIINPDGPSSCSLPSKCAAINSQSDVRLSSVEISSHHDHGHVNEHGTFSTVIALAGSFDPRTTTLDKLRRVPHLVSKSQHSNTLSRIHSAADGSIELMHLASLGSGSEAGIPDSPDRSASLGHAHRSSVPKLLIPTDPALVLENVRGGSDEEKTPTKVGLADPNEFVYRTAGWHRSTNGNSTASQAAASVVAAAAPVAAQPVPAVTLRPSPNRAITTTAKDKLHYTAVHAVPPDRSHR
ncbi:BQ2448_4547 [Microbotryum intermedium]|uniref:BQ2448_4547 protein n=1 Tax=Microbotryum intermedium TaxID=269621 RepID=A0A238FIM5_9BASI|nr:BQ2448_4547 [Microbotryum intermedium]